MQKEIWKDVVGYEGYYMVSNLGRVKSLDRTVKRKGRGFLRIKGRVKSIYIGKNGYYAVGLNKDGKDKTVTVHQLVAVAFKGHTPCGLKWVINHKDLNKLNNHVDNLEVVTNRENSSYRKKRGTSEYVGVSYNKAENKWQSSIQIKGKGYSLGYFYDELDAAKAYQDRLKLHLETGE
jgi:hypothetical protein